MDKLEYLEALTAYSKNPTAAVPLILEQYLNGVANNGETLFQWPLLKPLILGKLKQVIEDLAKGLSSETIPERPNMENVSFDVMHERILEAVHRFNGAPFTIQRLCELLIDPRRHYKRSDKYLRGLEKNVLVVSTVDPYGRKVVSESRGKHLLNGLETVNSPFGSRDSNISTILPPVPGWVQSAASPPPRSPVRDPPGQKETRFTMNTEATEIVTYDEEESLRGDDSSASSSLSSSELSATETSDSSDLASSMWASAGSKGDNKTPHSLTGPGQVHKDDTDKSETLVPDSHTMSADEGQAGRCEQPNSTGILLNDSTGSILNDSTGSILSDSTGSILNDSTGSILNDSTGFDTALKPETTEEQADSPDFTLRWSESGDSTLVKSEYQSGNLRLEHESGDFLTLVKSVSQSGNLRLEHKSSDSNVGIPEHKSSDSNIGIPEHKSSDSNSSIPEHKSSDSNSGIPEHKSSDSKTGIPEDESGDSNSGIPKPKCSDTNNVKQKPENQHSNAEKPEPEIVDSNDVRPEPESVNSDNITPEPESVNSDNITPEPESVNSNNITPEPESVNSDNITSEPDFIHSNAVLTESEKVDTTDVRPMPDSATDVRPMPDSAADVRPMPDSATDVRPMPDSAKPINIQSEPESAGSNDVRPESESLNSNEFELRSDCTNSHYVSTESVEADSDVSLASPYKDAALPSQVTSSTTSVSPTLDTVDSTPSKSPTQDVDSAPPKSPTLDSIPPKSPTVDSAPPKSPTVDSTPSKSPTQDVDSAPPKRLTMDTVDSTPPKSPTMDTVDTTPPKSPTLNSTPPKSPTLDSTPPKSLTQDVDSGPPKSPTQDTVDSTVKCGCVENIEDSEVPSPSTPQSILTTCSRNEPQRSLFSNLADSSSSCSAEEPQAKRRKLSDGTSSPSIFSESTKAVTTSSSCEVSDGTSSPSICLDSSDTVTTSSLSDSESFLSGGTTSDFSSKDIVSPISQYSVIHESMDVVSCSDDTLSTVALEDCSQTKRGPTSPPFQLSSSSDSQGFAISCDFNRTNTQDNSQVTQSIQNDEGPSLSESMAEPMLDD